LGNELTGAVAGRRFAWLITILAAVTLLATVAQQSHKANAAALTAVGVFQAPAQAAGLTETWTVPFTPATTVPAGGTVTVGFPTSFTTTGVIAGGVTFSVCATVPTVASVNVATNGTIIITTATNATGTAACVVTIAGIVNPATNATLTTVAGPNTATAGFNVTTSVDTVTTNATAPKVWASVGTAAPLQIPADGASSSIVTFAITPAPPVGNGGVGCSVTLQTSTGSFGGVAFITGGLTFTPGAGGLTAIAPCATITGNIVATVTAPTAAGSASVTLRVTPAISGSSVLVGTATLTFTPGSVTVTPAAVSMGNAIDTEVITIAAVDSSGNAVPAGTAVRVTVSTGTFAACPAGGAAAAICTTTIGSGAGAGPGQAKVTVTGAGVSLLMKITATVGAVSGAATVQLTGPATLITLVSRRPDLAQAGSVLPFSPDPRPTVDTTTGVGSDVVLATVKDADGNLVAGAAVSYVVNPTDGGVSVENETGGPLCVSRITSVTVSFLGNSCQAVIANATAIPGARYTITASTTNALTGVVYSASAVVTIGAVFNSTASTITVVAPDLAVNAVGIIKAMLKDSAGNLFGDGTSVVLVASAGSVVAGTALTANGVATFTYVSPGTAQAVALTAVVGTISNTKTINVGPPPSAGPVEPGAIGAGGQLCFTYSGPTKALANFAAYFAAGVDGVNVQASTGTYKSWFRVLPSAATLTTLTTGDRVCAAGVALKVFA